jgi:hypothetical protein
MHSPAASNASARPTMRRLGDRGAHETSRIAKRGSARLTTTNAHVPQSWKAYSPIAQSAGTTIETDVALVSPTSGTMHPCVELLLGHRRGASTAPGRSLRNVARIDRFGATGMLCHRDKMGDGNGDGTFSLVLAAAAAAAMASSSLLPTAACIAGLIAVGSGQHSPRGASRPPRPARARRLAS